MKYLIIGLLFIASCKSSESESKQTQSVEDIISKQLGTSIERKDNGDLALCYSKNKSLDKWKTVLVINHKSGEIIYGPKKMNADVDWHSENMLRIKEYPEVIQDQNSTNSFVYYYDLISQKKMEAAK